MVAEAIDADYTLDSPPQMEPEAPKRKRRTKAEMAADAEQPKPAAKSKLERFTRFADLHALARAANGFANGFCRDKRDPLTDWDRQTAQDPVSELEQLVTAFDAYQAATPKLHKYVEKALSASPGVAFAVVCIGLALPRLERHGLLPWIQRMDAQEAATGPQSASGEGAGYDYQNGYHPAETVAVGAA